jgi:uncharacterized protein DUF3307
MAWAEVFLVFVICHLAGDFLLQTDRQALHKHGGLGRDPTSSKALVAHVSTYTLAFVPAFAWLWGADGPRTIAVAALIALPHLAQDDGRLLELYVRNVKGLEPQQGPLLAAVDQSLHLLALFAAALVASI